jgi:NAD-reducing hydrogenase small subunit
MSTKVKVATVWLDGCSGCHMSFLDIDERLLWLGDRIDLVYSPLVDFKEFPDAVDVTLVEGAVASEEDLNKIKKIRAKTKVLVSFGDCAVTSNVPGMRNPFGAKATLERSYIENSQTNPVIPDQIIPKLLNHARPVHEYVPVDVFIPGCPPSADTIFEVLGSLIEGKNPDIATKARFG